MTDAVIREFSARTRFRVTPIPGADADAVLHGTILKRLFAAHLQLRDPAVVELCHYHRRFGHAQRARRHAFSTRTRITSSASSTSPPPTCPHFCRRTRRPLSGSRASLRGSWWPMSWKVSDWVDRGRGFCPPNPPPDKRRNNGARAPIRNSVSRSAGAHQQAGDVIVAAGFVGRAHQPRAQFVEGKIDAQQRLDQRVGEFARETVGTEQKEIAGLGFEFESVGRNLGSACPARG